MQGDANTKFHFHLLSRHHGLVICLKQKSFEDVIMKEYVNFHLEKKILKVKSIL
jgi:hypothetical protein